MGGGDHINRPPIVKDEPRIRCSQISPNASMGHITSNNQSMYEFTLHTQLSDGNVPAS